MGLNLTQKAPLEHVRLSRIWFQCCGVLGALFVCFHIPLISSTSWSLRYELMVPSSLSLHFCLSFPCSAQSATLAPGTSLPPMTSRQALLAQETRREVEIQATKPQTAKSCCSWPQSLAASQEQMIHQLSRLLDGRCWPLLLEAFPVLNHQLSILIAASQGQH